MAKLGQNTNPRHTMGTTTKTTTETPRLWPVVEIFSDHFHTYIGLFFLLVCLWGWGVIGYESLQRAQQHSLQHILGGVNISILQYKKQLTKKTIPIQ